MEGAGKRTSRWRRRGGVGGGYLGLALGLAGLWLLLGDGDEGPGIGLVVAGAVVVTAAGVTLWNRAFGVPILVGPPAAAVVMLVRYATANAGDRELGWAVVSGAMLAVTVLIFGLARHGVRKATREGALERDGMPALAEVLSIGTTGWHVGPTPQVLLEVELTPEHGRPYRVQRKMYVSTTKMPRPGDVLNAKVDRDDPQRWSVDLEPDHWRRIVAGAQPE